MSCACGGGCGCKGGAGGNGLTLLGRGPGLGIDVQIPPITWKTTVLPGVAIFVGAAALGGLVYFAARRK